jgi:hypothetical protein
MNVGFIQYVNNVKQVIKTTTMRVYAIYADRASCEYSQLTTTGRKEESFHVLVDVGEHLHTGDGGVGEGTVCVSWELDMALGVL